MEVLNKYEAAADGLKKLHEFHKTWITDEKEKSLKEEFNMWPAWKQDEAMMLWMRQNAMRETYTAIFLEGWEAAIKYTEGKE